MHANPSPYHDRTCHLGTLCFGGDWACAHGDVSGLRDVAQQLAAALREPWHDALIELAEECHQDADRAAQTWFLLKDRLFQDRLAVPRLAPGVLEANAVSWRELRH
jgi:hypothetical protein